jgi:hypothetical protein
MGPLNGSGLSQGTTACVMVYTSPTNE